MIADYVHVVGGELVDGILSRDSKLPRVVG